MDRFWADAELFGDLVWVSMPRARRRSRWLGRWLASRQLDDHGSGERLVGAGAPAGLVEFGGDLGVGVVVEESVDLGERVGGGLARFPGVQCPRECQGGGLAAAEADVEMNLIGSAEGDVLDQ